MQVIHPMTGMMEPIKGNLPAQCISADYGPYGHGITGQAQ